MRPRQPMTRRTFGVWSCTTFGSSDSPVKNGNRTCDYGLDLIPERTWWHRSSIGRTRRASSPVSSVNFCTPAEDGQDPVYALRSATKLYRTTPLRGLWHPPQLTGPYFHDGHAVTLAAVVDHYVQLRGLSLTSQQRADLIEYLKSL